MKKDGGQKTFAIRLPQAFFALCHPAQTACTGLFFSCTECQRVLTNFDRDLKSIAKWYSIRPESNPTASLGIQFQAVQSLIPLGGVFSMSSPLLEVKDLQVVVGEENKVLLDGLNLTVNAGETHVLMGHNGAGKSTLMSALMGNPAIPSPAARSFSAARTSPTSPPTCAPRRACSCPSRRRRRFPASRWRSFCARRRCRYRQARQGHEVPKRAGRPDGSC